MSSFDWKNASQSFSDFGGQEKTLRIPKTGLPFFDVLRLYGAIELFAGLQQEVFVHDAGSDWTVRARVREQRLKDLHPIARTLKKKDLSKGDEIWIRQLKEAVLGAEWPMQNTRDVSKPLKNPDSALRKGVRDTAAARYSDLETGYGKESKVPFADALLAYAGQERTETVAGIYFLPVFEGRIDFSKVVSPLRAWLSIPNVLCAQALTLLALKTSLFAEGYADKLSAVTYNTNFDSRSSFNYSGLIRIDSTALGRNRKTSPDFVGNFYRTFRSMLSRAWERGKVTPEFEDALAHAYWLMQPSLPKHLSSLVTALERQKRNGKPCIIAETKPKRSYVKEVFQMSYGRWAGDHEAVQKYAKAVASAIYYLWKADIKRNRRVLSAEERRKSWGKTWYDNVVMLRSAPTAKPFFERAQIIIEQGKRENQFIGSAGNTENFDPILLLKSVGSSRVDFETFRDLFRMYLVQESNPRVRGEIADEMETEETTTPNDIKEEGGEDI